MSWREEALLRLNTFLPKREQPVSASAAGSYSEAQYRWATGDVALFGDRLDLRGKVVLDAGCGPGGKTAFYAERGPKKITGVDRTRDSIDQAIAYARQRKLENVDFKVASLDALPFEAESFDLMIMNDVVEHIAQDLLAPAFSEARRVLKRGGELALYFPPWTSFDASHLYYQIHVPWCQLLFSDETLIAALRRTFRGNQAQVDAAITHYRELNRITIEQFLELVKRSGLEVEYFHLKTIKNVPRTGIMFVDRYLTKRVVAVLRK